MKFRLTKSMIPALSAAALFGASAPAAKILLDGISPVLLAALLYLGGGFGLLLLAGMQKILGFGKHGEAGLSLRDLPWLCGSVLIGGVLAPVLLMTGLSATTAATASLLLNFEAAATTFLAVLLFHEWVGRRVWLAVGTITAGSILLTWESGAVAGFSLAALGIVAACFSWGLDNNITRVISGKSPLSIALFKGLCAGSITFVLAILNGSILPPLPFLAAALILGFFSYGTSTVLFVFSLRDLGAARTGALFATAPFIGTAISLALFGAGPDPVFLLAFIVMAFGAVLLFREEHSHMHRHDRLEHDHRHRHDDGHHDHVHPNGVPKEHSHFHIHEPVEHSHSHTPDIHHRHTGGDRDLP